MNKSLTIALIACFIVINGCTSRTQNPPSTPQPPTSTQITQTTPSKTPQQAVTPIQVNGKDIYDKNCVGCHGLGGIGGTAPKLNKSEWSDPQKVSRVVIAGQKGMSAFKGILKDDEITAVTTYVSTLPK